MNKTMFYYSFHSKNPGPVHHTKVMENKNTTILIYALDLISNRKLSRFKEEHLYFSLSSRVNCEIDIQYVTPEEHDYTHKKQSNSSESSFGSKPTITKDDPYYIEMLKMFNLPRKDKINCSTKS